LAGERVFHVAFFKGTQHDRQKYSADLSYLAQCMTAIHVGYQQKKTNRACLRRTTGVFNSRSLFDWRIESEQNFPGTNLTIKRPPREDKQRIKRAVREIARQAAAGVSFTESNKRSWEYRRLCI
jgi:hypothetical protein